MNMNHGIEIMMTPKPQMTARMHPGQTIKSMPSMTASPKAMAAIATQRRQGTETHGAAGTGYPAEPKASVAAPLAKTPVIAAQVLSPEAQEQKRLQEIDEIAPVINDETLVNEAKYGDIKRGIFPCSAAELAFKAAQKRVESLAYKDVDTAVAAAKGFSSGQKARIAEGRRMAHSVLHLEDAIVFEDVDAGVAAAKGYTNDQRARFEEGRRATRALVDNDTGAQATK
jgi:hypothetical protein